MLLLTLVTIQHMDMVGLIATRRDGGIHSSAELEYIARGAASGSIPDYQLAAWLMAAYLNPLSDQETADLTTAMAFSGERVDLTGLPEPWVDKHSTGGVGDKTTIVLLPLLAACGLTVVKMSGPGLGITGGTVDKLSSVPGFRMDLSPEEMKEQAKKIGLAITGQTPVLAPADKTLYALRDVTATVPSLPLIVSSILSKKIAGGAKIVVLDVKCGRGSFNKTPDDARALAAALKSVGESAGLKVEVRITDMEQPLGRAAGNAIEVQEAIRVLKGETGRFTDLCLELARTTLQASGLNPDLAQEKLGDGSALAKAKEWFEYQGGDLSVFEDESWSEAPVFTEVMHSGIAKWVESIDAQVVGQVVLNLGGGRKEKGDSIDTRVGVETLVEVGSQVTEGDPLFYVLAAEASASSAAANALKQAITFSEAPIEKRPVVLN
ncbi:thymidine phosphorylase [Geitlerinema splendidum]|nr:thymidine phosphorylase [Geitlerinema splendidum]